MIRRWPIANLGYSLLCGLGAFLVLLGSQPSSPIALGELDPGISQWVVPVALFVVCFLVPTGCVILVRGYRSDSSNFIGLDLNNFPGGRHSLQNEFPRRAAILSTLILGYAWFSAQSQYFSGETTGGGFPVRLIQLVGGLVLVFALFQWTYGYLFEKTAAKAGVSTAPIVGIIGIDSNSPTLILEDGTTRKLNLIYIPEWSPKNMGTKRVALVLESQSDSGILYVTVDGECFYADVNTEK